MVFDSLCSLDRSFLACFSQLVFVASMNLDDHWWKLLCGEIVEVRSGRDLFNSPIPKADPGLFSGRDGALSESESEFGCCPDRSLFLGTLRLVWLINLVRSLIEVWLCC